jgi:hypothetical protein
LTALASISLNTHLGRATARARCFGLGSISVALVIERMGGFGSGLENRISEALPVNEHGIFTNNFLARSRFVLQGRKATEGNLSSIFSV